MKVKIEMTEVIWDKIFIIILFALWGLFILKDGYFIVAMIEFFTAIIRIFSLIRFIKDNSIHPDYNN